jgi:hypothetical protein
MNHKRQNALADYRDSPATERVGFNGRVIDVNIIQRRASAIPVYDAPG